MENCLSGDMKCTPSGEVEASLQGGWGGWPTGNGKKLSSSQAQLGQSTCLAVAYFLSISGATSTVYPACVLRCQILGKKVDPGFCNTE